MSNEWEELKTRVEKNLEKDSFWRSLQIVMQDVEEVCKRQDLYWSLRHNCDKELTCPDCSSHSLEHANGKYCQSGWYCVLCRKGWNKELTEQMYFD